MANYDLRLDVPARAYINAQLLSLLERGGTLFEAKKQLFSTLPYVNSGMTTDNYSILDHSFAVPLLYCIIVVPNEILNVPPNHKIYRDFDTAKVHELFTITNPTIIDSYTFIRALRNSVAHALYSVTHSGSEMQYEFWTTRKPILKAAIGHRGLIKFLDIVGQRLANEVLAQKAAGGPGIP